VIAHAAWRQRAWPASLGRAQRRVPAWPVDGSQPGGGWPQPVSGKWGWGPTTFSPL